MPPKILRDELIEDSSDEDTSTTEPTQTLKQQADGISRIASASHRDQSSDSNDDVSDEDSDTNSSSSKSSQSSSSSKRKAPAVTVTSPTKRSKVNYGNVRRTESTAYIPPSGFSKFNTGSSDDTSRVSNMFQNLEGKQIWHIIAPGDMPISELTTLDITAGLRGTTILEHDETSYSITSVRTDNSSLLLARGRDATYVPAKSFINRSFRIQESSKPQPATVDENLEHNNGESTDSLIFFATKVGEKKAAREQPPNLKGRYVPYGVKTSDSADANEDTTATRDAEMTDNNESIVQKTPNSSKKRRQERLGADRMDVDQSSSSVKLSSQLSATTDATPSKKKKKREKRRESVE